MTEVSPGLGLPYLQPSQAQKHVTHNQALQRLDQLVQLRLIALDVSTPPADPTAGECYALASSPSGIWAGQGDQLACWDGAAWQFLTPAEGWLAWDLAAGLLRVWQDSTLSWEVAAPEQLQRLGIATDADATNRLAVAAPATLLSHDGSDHQLKINKASDGDTASLLFQSNWAGHAELGLVGDTALALKVSADGSTWQEIMRADPALQQLDWSVAGAAQMSLSPGSLQLDVPLAGSAVQSDLSDASSGRLMMVGAFGLGGNAIKAEGSDLNSIAHNGLWYADSTVANRPIGNGNWLVLHIQQTSAVAVQLALSRTSVAGNAIHNRYLSSGVWTDWALLYSQATVLGSVSQSGGTPTGAMIERGSNANGDYVRFADGTQICSFAMAASATQSSTWSFPAAFVASPQLSVSPISTSACFATHHGGSAGASDFDVWDIAGSRVAQSCDLIASGRWF